MKVNAKLDDVTITLGNKGITLNISTNDGKHRGDLRLGQATVEWMKGRTHEGNGIKIPLSKLLDMIETLE